MFKLTRNGGLRRASPSGGQSSRVDWGGGTPIRSVTTFPGPVKPPFVPIPQEQGFDSNTSRVDESA